MIRNGITLDELVRRIAASMENDKRVLAVYLLGSAARDMMRRDSDVDLAILPAPGTKISPLDCFDMASRLSFETGYEIDTGVLGSGNLVYAREAILGGRRIFERDRTQADTAAMNLLGMYLVFNFDRREVLDAYSA